MKPILFSAEMVRAIQDLRKTQTRRVIKDKDITNWFDIDVDGKPIAYIDQETGDSYPPTHRAKYQPGDILWVRETWGVPISLAGDIIYKADFVDRKAPLADGEKWRPSIFMPRAAARIFLLVKAVKGERLQDITDADILAEGFECREDFIVLWNILNEKRGHGWNKNDWVYAYTFEKISKEEAKRLEGMK